MTFPRRYRPSPRAALILLAALVLASAALSLFVGSSGMSLGDALLALLGRGTPTQARILWAIRVPRMLAALIAGAGLSLSGLAMQTTLDNAMASPATLGVSNGAVFGANLSIIAFAGGFLDTGRNVASYSSGANPFATSSVAFLFALLSALLILGLGRLRAYAPGTVVLAGVAMGSVWGAGTTLLQFYATDVGLSAAVIWNFGDLGRATYRTDAIMAGSVLIGLIFFSLMAWRYNALLSGDASAQAMGVPVERLRFLTLLAASMITASVVSFLGVIGFVGIICPHVVKKLIGQDHRLAIPGSALCGAALLLLSDAFSRALSGGSALPVGAITTLLGAPFFLAIIFGGEARD